MLPHDVDVLLTLPKETEHLEFKKSKEQFDTTNLCKYCVALANEGGGTLLLGVTDKPPRKVVGTNAYPDLGKIKKQIFDKLRFRVDVEAVEHPEGRVLAFSIPSRPKGTAYAYEGAYLMRVGEGLTPMTEEQLRKIFAEGSPDFLLRNAKEGLSSDDVVSLLETHSYFDLINIPYPTTRKNVLERFKEE
ncbi:ATP-binding protein [Mailhella sp.]|uniref:ATP-binding protein n=1 Tax=Mailhella sp. TaxID=1981029 RepID=UPI004063B6DA